MNLLVLIDRMIDEGPCGFRFRLAVSNLLSSADLMKFEICGEIEAVHAPASSVALSESFNPWVSRWSRFCPSCLASRKCWMIGWEVLFADACAECGSWLVDRCSSCDTQLSWKRNRLLHCDCGKYLADEVLCTAPLNVVRLSRALQSVALGTKPNDIALFNGLTLGQCVRFVRLLGTYGNSTDCRPQKVVHVDSLRVSWPITSMAAEVLASWPTGLARLLENLRSQGNIEGKGRLSHSFGGFYSALYKGFSDIEFAFLRADFENYVVEHWTGAIGKRNRRLDETMLKKMSWIPANHACRLLDVSRRRLLDFIQDGRLQGEKRSTLGRREFIVVKRSEVEKLAFTLDDGITLSEVSIRLGLNKRRLLRLLPIVCPQAKRLGSQGCPWAIPSAWIGDWEALIRMQVQIEPTDSNTVGLGHLIRYRPWTDEQIGLLLIGILNGEIVPAGVLESGNGVGALALNVGQLERWFAGKQWAPCAELTIPRVAVRIGVKQEVVYALVRSGLLLATLRKVGRRCEQRVKVAVLEEFEQRFTFCRDIAKLLGHSPRAIAKFLSTEGVLPVAGPGVDRCRQLVFKRDDVNKCLAVNGLKRITARA